MTDIGILEGILFAFGDEGVEPKQLQIALNHDEDSLRKLLDEYKDQLKNDNRGFELVEYGGVVKIITKASLHEVISEMFEFNKTRQLSQAALETLAIIAYKQPITRLEVEEIRGVNSDMMMRRLEALDLVKESGRADSPGRPILYQITETFMDMFKLTSLKELPEIKLEQLEDNYDLFKQN